MSNIDSGHTHSNGVLDGINGAHNVELDAHPGPNGISPKISAIDSHNHLSPATDSPATPADEAAPDVKIDMDYQEQESDVRHEPLPVKSLGGLDKPPSQSHPAPRAPSVDPGTSPLHTPNEDVKMADTNGHVNGHTEDVVMTDGSQTPAATPGISNEFAMANLDGSSTSVVRSYPDEHDDDEPPAKRARVHSDAELASTAHSATPPPASALSNAASPVPIPPPPTTASTTAPAPPTPSSSVFPPGENTFTPAQYRFCVSTVRTLKKQKDAIPFLRPVDPVALNIPHYLTIIRNPMDLSTIDRKLLSSNPAKPDPNPNNPRYYKPEEFIADFRLIIYNTMTFNGPEHVVTQMGKRLEEIFDKQIKQLPPTEAAPPPPPPPKPKPVVAKPKPAPAPKKVDTPPPPAPVPTPSAASAPKKAPPARRPSMTNPVIRRSDAEPVGRPKREIHPPPPKDLPYAEAPRKNRKNKKVKDDGTLEQLKFCGKIWHELHKKSNAKFAGPFYEPVDWQKLDLPSYPRIVRKPMDLSTMKKKLDEGEYPTASKFYEDFKLMIRNCFLFNPAGTHVNAAGVELQRLFDEKWKALPPLHPVAPSEDEEDEEEEEDSDDQRARRIAQIENAIESMRSEVDNLKSQKLKKKEAKKPKEKEKPPVASTSKPAPPKPPKAPSKKKQKKAVADEDVLSFDQKKDLSDAIGKLEGTRLERVIQIIHEGVPEIRDSTEEIELEIDQLPSTVLTKLYNFVLRPLRQPPPNKRSRSGKGTGTGGLKRKSMDEEKEAEKIRQLEERMALFEGANSAPVAARRDVDSDHSSDSSSDDSSGSDSE